MNLKTAVLATEFTESTERTRHYDPLPLHPTGDWRRSAMLLSPRGAYFWFFSVFSVANCFF